MAYPVLYWSRLRDSCLVFAFVTYRNIFCRNSFTQGSRFVARNLQASHPGVLDRCWLYRRRLADLLHIHDLYAEVSDKHRAYERSNSEYVMTAVLCTYMILQPPFGAFSDRFGRKTSMLLFGGLATAFTDANPAQFCGAL